MLAALLSAPAVVSPPADHYGLAVDVAAATVAITIAEFAMAFFIHRAMPNNKDPYGVADTLFSVIYFPPVVALAMYSTWELGGDTTNRWHAVSPRSHWYHVIYIARCFAHIPLLPLMKMKPSHRHMTAGHHLLSVVAYGSILVNGRIHYYGAFDGVCEITNIFLTVLYLYKIEEFKLEKLFPTIYSANGVFLWLSFIVFRLALFPYWLYQFGTDINVAPEETWERSSRFELLFYPFVTLSLLAMSIDWFRPITRGLFKVLVKKKRDDWKVQDHDNCQGGCVPEPNANGKRTKPVQPSPNGASKSK